MKRLDLACSTRVRSQNHFGEHIRSLSVPPRCLNPLGPQQDEPKYAYGLRISDPEKRLRYFVHLCQSKKLDEATGNPQPSYRLEGLKIMAEFPKIKGDEEQEQDNVERKQVRTAGQGLGRASRERDLLWNLRIKSHAAQFRKATERQRKQHRETD